MRAEADLLLILLNSTDGLILYLDDLYPMEPSCWIPGTVLYVCAWCWKKHQSAALGRLLLSLGKIR